jgi:histidine triad (HIT) family protein
MAYDDQNIFAKILRGEADAFRVFENDECLAFLDVMPQSDGHTLVLPKAPVQNIFELDERSASALILTVQHITHGVQTAFEPQGIRLMQLNGAAAGQTVFHLHVHIIPCYEGQGLQRHSEDMAPADVLVEHAKKLRTAIEGLE